jgi:UDP-N-acetylglucosamine--N-acetylmuramyl-(pentapeptide) pyrophosphoryl-undecaprenol N-acetylglucosamine transferase
MTKERRVHMKTRIAFTGGGTGGHIFPGLAVSESLRERTDADFFWIGSRRGMEKKILDACGFPFTGIPAGKLRRYLSMKNFFDLWRTLAGIVNSFFILLSRRPAVLFSKGGYVSVPPVLAAGLLGIPVVTHESDFDPGLATRINARIARRICVSYPETVLYFSGALRQKTVVTGNPVRAAILSGDQDLGKRIAGCPPDLPLILVLGGSLGADSVNRLVIHIRPRLTERAFLVHQTGKPLPGDQPPPRVLSRPFFNEELPHLLAAADLVIGRAGANTLWELAAAGKPSLLIPLPTLSSRGDQLRNADVFASRGAALVLTEESATPAALLAMVENLLDNKDRLRRMGDAARGIFIPDARERIARIILSLMPRHNR